jgi:tRNA nucleotidyltransferase (CCA-adding enzyme)
MCARPDADPLERLPALPGGSELLAAAQPGVHLVGGAVRDLLMGTRPRELDVVVEGPIEPLLAALGGERVVHDRFGTASVELGDGARVDVARARRERYPRPGALPEVEPARLDEDLLRRDFTVNAIAVGLAGCERGSVSAAPRALEDLRAGRLRVLHDESFRDDPTRLLRLGRYAARLGFAVEEATAALAREALRAGALATVSGARVGAELRLALREPDAAGAIAKLHAIGALGALGLAAPLDERALASARELLPADGRADVLVLAALLIANADALGGRAGAARMLDRFELAAPDRDRALAATAAPELARGLPRAARASQLHDLLAGAPVEAVALAGALAGAGDPSGAARARRWLEELRHVRLEIGGEDLLAAGIAQGPEIGRRLRAALRMRLDGEIGAGREAELRGALEAT